MIPSWVKIRWGYSNPWKALGLLDHSIHRFWRFFFKGVLFSLGIIFILIAMLVAESSVNWLGDLSGFELCNAVFLAFGVGFSEELIFRGWLLGEMNQLFGAGWGIIAQAMVFSLVHMRFDSGIWQSLVFLFGLFLLGSVLGLMRLIDGGSLWGCIGFHGGLVGIWFVFAGLVEISPDASQWLVGGGGLSPNPIGGGVGIIALGVMLWRQLIALAITRRPFNGALKASSRGAAP